MSTLQSCLWSVLGPTMGHIPTNGQSINSQQKKRREKKSTDQVQRQDRSDLLPKATEDNNVFCEPSQLPASIHHL